MERIPASDNGLTVTKAVLLGLDGTQVAVSRRNAPHVAQPLSTATPALDQGRGDGLAHAFYAADHRPRTHHSVGPTAPLPRA